MKPRSSLDSNLLIPLNITESNVLWQDCENVLPLELLEEITIQKLGDQSIGTNILPVAIIYLIIFISGILGNCANTWVIISSKDFHTPTYIYMLSLSISGITILLGIPYELYISFQSYPWKFGEFACILKHFISEFSSYASILTVTMFAVERFIAVTNPFRSYIDRNIWRALKMLAIVWIFSIFSAAIMAYQFGLQWINISEYNCSIIRTTQCTLTFSREIPNSLEISSILFFLIPMLIITVLHIIIGIKLQSAKRRLYFQTYNRDDISMFPIARVPPPSPQLSAFTTHMGRSPNQTVQKSSLQHRLTFPLIFQHDKPSSLSAYGREPNPSTKIYAPTTSTENSKNNDSIGKGKSYHKSSKNSGSPLEEKQQNEGQVKEATDCIKKTGKAGHNKEVESITINQKHSNQTRLEIPRPDYFVQEENSNFHMSFNSLTQPPSPNLLKSPDSVLYRRRCSASRCGVNAYQKLQKNVQGANKVLGIFHSTI